MAVQRNPETGQPIISGDVASLQEELNALGDFARTRGIEAVDTFNSLALIDYVAPGTIREVLEDQSLYLYVSDAAGWVRIWKRSASPYAIATGIATNPAGQFRTVGLPANRFTVPPIIQITPIGAVIGTPTVENVTPSTRTATQFRAALFGSNNVAISSVWMWTAIQMTPTSAEG